MEVVPQIDFQGAEPSAYARDRILRQIDTLEKRFGRITSCRVVIKTPGAHHREGQAYEINIWLSLPGHKEVAVVRTPKEDERHADIDFAINDAFKRARRRLQDRIRLMENRVKSHVPQASGIVSELPDGSDHGFLTAEDGRQIYFHRNAVLHHRFSKLKVGMHVNYVEEEGDKGPQASTVRVIQTPRARHSLH